jgi:nitroreductase
VSENIYLAGAAPGLQTCATAGFIDDELDTRRGWMASGAVTIGA